MNKILLRYLGLALICIITFFAGNKAVADSAKKIKVYKHGFIVKVGDRAPDFKIDYVDKQSKSVKLSALRGSVVLLQFTASWCGVCRSEMPALEKEIWQRFKGKNFKLIGIDLKEPVAKIKAFITKTGVSYPLALDLKGNVFNLYARGGVTRNVLIDQSGKIVFLTRLYHKNEFKALINKIETLLPSQACSKDGGC